MIDLDKAFAYKEPEEAQINRLLSMYRASIFLARVINHLLPDSSEKDTLILEVADVMRRAQRRILPPV